MRQTITKCLSSKEIHKHQLYIDEKEQITCVNTCNCLYGWTLKYIPKKDIKDFLISLRTNAKKLYPRKILYNNISVLRLNDKLLTKQECAQLWNFTLKEYLYCEKIFKL